MNNWHLLYRMAIHRHREDISKAENYWMLHNRQDDNHQTVRVKWYHRVLGRMGSAMVKWGFQFQSRYQAVDRKKSKAGPAMANSRYVCTIEGPTKC